LPAEFSPGDYLLTGGISRGQLVTRAFRFLTLGNPSDNGHQD